MHVGPSKSKCVQNFRSTPTSLFEILEETHSLPTCNLKLEVMGLVPGKSWLYLHVGFILFCPELSSHCIIL